MGTEPERFLPGDQVRLRNDTARRIGLVVSDSPEHPRGAKEGELGYFVLFGDESKTWARGSELVLVMRPEGSLR
jgi:hypothetical protein